MDAGLPELKAGPHGTGRLVLDEPATVRTSGPAFATELLLALLIHAAILAALFIRLPPSPPYRPVEPPAISVELVPPKPRPVPKLPEHEKKPEPQKPLPQTEPEPPKPSLHRESGGTDLSRTPGAPPKTEAKEAPEPQVEIKNAPSAPKTETALPDWARKLAKGLDLPKASRKTQSAKATRPKYVIDSNHDGEGGGDPYLTAMRNQVAAHIVYPPEAGGRGGVVIYQFLVAKDGRLVSLVLARSSGVRALDFAVENAIRASLPFRPLPPDYEAPAPITATIPIAP